MLKFWDKECEYSVKDTQFEIVYMSSEVMNTYLVCVSIC